jgi:hypothetical protein
MDKYKRGQSPYGFYWQAGQLLLEEAEAKVRSKAAELFLSLKSMGAVARELNSAGHLTRRGGQWSDMQVARILECPSAIGAYEINRTAEKADGKRRKTSKTERLIVECEPILTREVWKRLTALIQENRTKRRTSEEEKAPLTGLVWCTCGQRMNKPSDSPRYKCGTCETLIAEADLEAIFAEDFAELLASHPILFGALETSPERRHTMAELLQLESELEEATARRAGVERMFTQSSISKDRFEELHLPLERQVRALEGKIATLRSKLTEEPPSSAEKSPPMDWQSLWSSWPTKKRRAIITSFVSTFVVGTDEVEIAYLLPEPSGSKDTAPSQQITPPTNQSAKVDGPAYIRLPKPGSRCQISGLSRSKLNELILPNKRNHFRPEVASKSLRQKGAQRGVRLVLLESLMAYLSGSSQ